MAYTLTEKQTNLDELRRAHDLGARRVSFQGRTVEYHTIADLERAIDRLESEIAAELGSTVRPIAALGVFSREEPTK